jgi:hypothetical protein
MKDLLDQAQLVDDPEQKERYMKKLRKAFHDPFLDVEDMTSLGPLYYKILRTYYTAF